MKNISKNLKANKQNFCTFRQCQADCVSRKISGRIYRKEKLIANKRPVGDGARCTLFLQLYDAKIKQFENGIVVRKRTALCHLAQTGIERLNGIGRVHNLTHRRRVIKKLFDVGETTFRFEARCTVDFFSSER